MGDDAYELVVKEPLKRKRQKVVAEVVKEEEVSSKLTDAEKNVKKVRNARQKERIEKALEKTHKQKMADLKKHLSSLTDRKMMNDILFRIRYSPNSKLIMRPDLVLLNEKTF